MPMTQEGGYRAPNMYQGFVNALNKLHTGSKGVHVIQPDHPFMWRPTNRLGDIPTLIEALKETNGMITIAAFSSFGGPEPKHLQYMPPSDTVELVPFGDILQKYESPEEAQISFDAYGARDRAWIYMAFHTMALRESLRKVGFDNPHAYLDELIKQEILERAHLVDRWVGSWLNDRKLASLANGYTPVLDFGDSVATMVGETIDGDAVRADMWNTLNPITSAEGLSGLPPRMQEETGRLYRGRITNTDLIGVFTNRDANKLTDLADYMQIPKAKRADVFVRDMIPPHFTEIAPKEVHIEDAADFMRDAVRKGRLIAGSVQRLDFIKMDPTVLNGFEAIIENLVQTESGRDILKNLRVAIVAEGGAIDVRNTTRVLFERYADHAHEKIDQINARFREIMQSIGGPADEDFILANRDGDGRLTGIKHEELSTSVYPFYDISFQLGEEGLCQSLQEANLTRLFGITNPKPPILVIARSVGFAEKAENFRLPNALIIDDQTDTSEFTDKFVEAYKRALSIKENPDSDLLKTSQKAMVRYGDINGSSYYVPTLEALYEAKQRRRPISG